MIEVEENIRRRRRSLAISEEAKNIPQQRLHKRYQAMAARGENKNIIDKALRSFTAIAIETEKQ